MHIKNERKNNKAVETALTGQFAMIQNWSPWSKGDMSKSVPVPAIVKRRTHRNIDCEYIIQSDKEPQFEVLIVGISTT